MHNSNFGFSFFFFKKNPYQIKSCLSFECHYIYWQKSASNLFLNVIFSNHTIYVLCINKMQLKFANDSFDLSIWTCPRIKYSIWMTYTNISATIQRQHIRSHTLHVSASYPKNLQRTNCCILLRLFFVFILVFWLNM